jgi:hypothetical protein
MKVSCMEYGELIRLRQMVSNGLGKMDRDRYTGREPVRWAHVPDVARRTLFHEF